MPAVSKSGGLKESFRSRPVGGTRFDHALPANGRPHYPLSLRPFHPPGRSRPLQEIRLHFPVRRATRAKEEPEVGRARSKGTREVAGGD